MTKMVQSKKVGVISLGCDKNRVDTEKMLAILSERHTLINDTENVEILIINTCAFLKSARKEALEEILSAILIKQEKDSKLEKIIVTGCLPQKFINEIYDELIEVDAFLGIDDYQKILEVIDEIYLGKRVNAVGNTFNSCNKKRIQTTSGYAYIKIADGCNNHCTYCLIPKIRGKFRSTPVADLIEEIKLLGEVDELILVAQDVTQYGLDLTPKSSLVELIRVITTLDSVRSLRLLYCYPEGITNQLIDEIKNNQKVIKYIDIPLQHADKKILKLMNRKGNAESYLSLINKLKESIDGIAIRSTFITGFPGEGQEEFENLVNFLKSAKLFNAGFFKYSKEEDTPSYKLEGHLKEAEKNKRLKKLYSIQKAIVRENLSNFIRKTIKVKAEGFDEERLVYYGRAYFNAPDIDGKIYFFSADEVVYGNYYDVKIIERSNYDLLGERV